MSYRASINVHTHLCMILGRTLGTDRSLLHWLSEAQVPLMQQFEPEDYAISMELGAIENLKAGNTTICEVFFSPHYEQEVDRISAKALDASGIRTVFFRCANDESFFEGFVETREQIGERSIRRCIPRQTCFRSSARSGSRSRCSSVRSSTVPASNN